MVPALVRKFTPWKHRRASAFDAPQPVPSIRESESAPAFASEAQHLDRIARASIQLASLGPRLAGLAGELEKKAQEQARRAAAAAETMQALTASLEKAVGELRAASTQVGGSLGTVEQIALHTRILSLNASIEAARAGVHGRGFAVVVEEVQRLADRTGATTKDIEQRIHEMQTSIVRVAEVTAAGGGGGATARNIGVVNDQVQGIAGLAGGQLEGAQSLHRTSHDINGLAELLLLAVGSFRFQAHREAEDLVAELPPVLTGARGNREDLELQIAAWLERHTCFELAYLADAGGVQITDNLARRHDRIERDPGARGRNWSERPWYRDALLGEQIHSTDLYRCASTGHFCFTVTARIHDESGDLAYVFGADVNFHRLVEQHQIHR